MPKHALPQATVAQLPADALRELGVRHAFGVPSGGWVDYMETLRRSDCIDFVLATHEGGAAMMADVCGRLNGVLGVCFGTQPVQALVRRTADDASDLAELPMPTFTGTTPNKQACRPPMYTVYSHRETRRGTPVQNRRRHGGQRGRRHLYGIGPE